MGDTTGAKAYYNTSNINLLLMKNISKDHSQLAEQFNKNEDRVNWHDETLWWIRQKRDNVVHDIAELEELRETASQIKNNVLAHLSEYLLHFEENLRINGVLVHWAADAWEDNNIVYSILQKHNTDRMMKSKSMLREKCPFK